jgi:RNA polymerase sigma-70 factor, ECF subfamily
MHARRVPPVRNFGRRASSSGTPIAQRTSSQTFEHRVAQLFEREFPRVFRVLQRLSGDADLASDLAQEAFVKLLHRGDMPDTPVPWLVTVALNQLRNTRSRERRREQLLAAAADDEPEAFRVPRADTALLQVESQQRVRTTLSQLPARQAALLMMSAEGYSYREIAQAMELTEASVGAMILRARRAFRALHSESADAS